MHRSTSPDTSSQKTLRMRPLARALPPGQPLLHLHGSEDDGAQYDGDGEVRYGQRLGVQKALEEGSVDRQDLQHERESDWSPVGIAMTWLIWERVRVVKTMVCQISGAVRRYQRPTPSDTSAMSIPTQRT
jgi:hypothetical protein